MPLIDVTSVCERSYDSMPEPARSILVRRPENSVTVRASDLEVPVVHQTGDSYLCFENVRLLRKRGCCLMSAVLILSSARNTSLVKDRLHMRSNGAMLAGMQTIKTT